ncbi:hypothetical protein DV735_g731, partial [Chaetothyriales sp. CBS 134920]
MVSALSIQPAFAALTPERRDEAERDSSPSTSAKGPYSSHNDVADETHDDSQSVVRLGQDNSDLAAQAEASAWSRRRLIVTYILLWLVTAVSSIFENVMAALGPYITSAFKLHSYAPATGIVASVVAALAPVPTMTLLKRLGRAQGMIIMLVIIVIGLSMFATCRGVAMYCAAQVFIAVGSAGMTYCISVFVADTTSLRNRAFMMAFSTSPDIITMWLAGPTASRLLNGIGWRWGAGMYAIIYPVAVIPFVWLILWNQHNALRLGVLQPKAASKETFLRRFKQAILDIDLAGLVILAAGLSLFLLAFTLYSFQAQGFGSPLIIGILVGGLSLMAAYPLYEWYVAPTRSIAYRTVCDRTVLGALVTLSASIVAFTNIIGYGTSYLQVVTGLDVTQTSFLISSIKVIVCFYGLIIGGLIHWTGRLRQIIFVLGAPPMFIGAALFLAFRHPDYNSTGIMSAVVILVSLSIGCISICSSLVMMAALGQQHVTTVLALMGFTTNIAPAIGEAINTAIWTGTFKQALHRHLQTLTDSQIQDIYSSLAIQLSFAEGSSIRHGIAMAYGDAKLYMLVTIRSSILTRHLNSPCHLLRYVDSAIRVERKRLHSNNSSYPSNNSSYPSNNSAYPSLYNTPTKKSTTTSEMARKLLYPTSLVLDTSLLEGFSVTLVPYDVTQPIPDKDTDAEILVTWTNTAANLKDAQQRLSQLKWIQSLAAGPNDVLNAGFDTTNKVALTTGSGLHDETVAEHALGLILSAARRFDTLRDYQVAGKWAGHLGGPQPDRPKGLFQSLKGANVLIWGFGNIAKHLAPWLAALGANVKGVARSTGIRNGVEVYAEDHLPVLLPATDVLVLILPGSAATTDVLNKARIALLPNHAWVVNVGRGVSVDEDALVDALNKRELGGAALDVFKTEPLPEGDKLYTTPNVIISPHAAGGRPRGAEALIAENLRRFLAGQKLKNQY